MTQNNSIFLRKIIQKDELPCMEFLPEQGMIIQCKSTASNGAASKGLKEENP